MGSLFHCCSCRLALLKDFFSNLRPDLVNIPVVQLSLPALSGRRGSEVARHCLEAPFFSAEVICRWEKPWPRCVHAACSSWEVACLPTLQMLNTWRGQGLLSYSRSFKKKSNRNG